MLKWWLRIKTALTRTEQISTLTRNHEIVVDDWRGVSMGCCDCGLVHDFDFRSDAAGRLHITGRRDVATTAALRRDRKFRFTKTSV